MSVINTNISATIAQNSLVKTNREMQTAMQQLSTGSRINSAKDDAAGLAISSKMTSQINGLNQAVRNANDGISLVQTAEGALVEVTNMLQRQRELAVQSANDSNTTADRNSLNLEYQELTKEIKRIADNTQFNGMNLLNNTAAGASAVVGAGTAREVKFQVGANAAQTISVTLKDFSFGTGTAAVAGEAALNLSDQDLSTAATFTFDIVRGATTTSFSVAAPAGIAFPATAANATAVASAMSSVVNNTVGFQNVEFSAVGSSIKIVDSEGGNAGNFAAADSTATALGSVPAWSSITTGTAAVGAVAPSNAAAVFGNTARINDTNITTQAKADEAIGRLDNALAAVNSERAVMGATINRLNFAADNLMNVSQNASESRSRVLDTDFAATTTELARTQIIAQAGTAMLAQANQQPQSVLALLQ